jgi:hypothetical protein
MPSVIALAGGSGDASAASRERGEAEKLRGRPWPARTYGSSSDGESLDLKLESQGFQEVDHLFDGSTFVIIPAGTPEPCGFNHPTIRIIHQRITQHYQSMGRTHGSYPERTHKTHSACLINQLALTPASYTKYRSGIP